VRALVRATDHVVLDALAGNCLREGALAATPLRHRFRHLDLDHLRVRLATIRAHDRAGGILVATESLFAVDATAPDLVAMQTLCREFGALLLVDVSHDLGCAGPGGTGQLGRQGLHGKADIVIGSFAKTFASNGGYVATRRREVREYLRYFSPTHAFSCALSPLQLGIVLAALRIVRSAEGDRRRVGMLTAAHALRGGLVARGATVLGVPAPIVPVLVGRDAAGRVAVKLAADAGVLANLVEAPLVPRHASRLRLLVSAAHEPAACEAGAARLVEAIARSHELPCRCDAA
jgi:glycine C-acetyltransferase/8-amino-7-oxononanoate synthase